MEITKTEEKKATIIHVTGRLDTNTAPDLESWLNDNITGAEKKIVFDFLNLDFISSAGLRVVVATQQSAAAFAVVCKKDGSVYDVFDMSGLSMMMDLFETTAEAV